jgi:hypothetical protein
VISLFLHCVRCFPCLFGPGSASLGCLKEVVERFLLLVRCSGSGVHCFFISFHCFHNCFGPGAASLGCLKEEVICSKAQVPAKHYYLIVIQVLHAIRLCTMSGDVIQLVVR